MFSGFEIVFSGFEIVFSDFEIIFLGGFLAFGAEILYLCSQVWGTRAFSPATDAGVDARAPRQNSVAIAVRYIEDDFHEKLKQERIKYG